MIAALANAAPVKDLSAFPLQIPLFQQLHGPTPISRQTQPGSTNSGKACYVHTLDYSPSVLLSNQEEHEWPASSRLILTCPRGQVCSSLHLFWFFSRGPLRDRLGPKCAVSISILLGMGRPTQFSELLSSLGRSLSRRPWGAEGIGDRPAVGLMGGPAQEAGGRALLLWVFQ